jgi:predicted DsbA family dithiol-disulfide isomerase
MSAKPRLIVDVVADFVCPWCFVGLHGFVRAAAALAPAFEIVPRYRAYQLNPDTPEAGVDRAAYYARKFPDAEQRAMMRSRLVEAARAAGADFDPAAPTRLPNTLRAHQVLRRAHFEGRQTDVALALYAAYWRGGADLGDVTALADAAAQGGLDRNATIDALRAGAGREEARAEAEAMRAAGVSGVPTFIVNERSGFSGALAPDALRAALERAHKLTMESAA